jgi:3-oxoacyl-[acyl-carrier-protein] synthase III
VNGAYWAFLADMILKPASGVIIKGVGHALPHERVSNQQLLAETDLPITPEWIKKRIGVETRYRVASDQATSDLAIAAARQAIENAQIDPHEIDLIVLSTISPDHPNPSTACAVQAGLGLSESLCPCLDISAACSGFIYGLDLGTRQILTGARHVLVIAAEIRSRFINPRDPSTYPIFGDGAAAMVLSSGPLGQGVLGVQTLADGRGYYSVHIPAGGSRLPASAATVAQDQHFIKMENGEKIFFEVVEGMSQYTQSFLKALGTSLDAVDFLIPHQANLHILKEVSRRLNLPPEKLLSNIQSVGNTSSASIPLCLSEFLQAGVIKPGQRVCLVAAGAGHTGGLALIQV